MTPVPTRRWNATRVPSQAPRHPRAIDTSPLPPVRVPRFAVALLAALTALTACGTQPDPITTRQQNAETDLLAYHRRAPQVDRPINLDHAIRLALENNLELWVAHQEYAYKQQIANQSYFRLLPRLLAQGDLSERSEFDAASSVSIISGTQSLEPSYSREKTRQSIELELTWDLLDFGVSYLRSRQAENRTAIAGQKTRRTRQQLALEVTRAWWHAVAAREVAQRSEQIASRIETFRKALQQQTDAKAISDIEALKKETALLEQQLVLHRYRKQYESARAELARLMGLRVGQPFELAEVDFDTKDAGRQFDIPALEKQAILSRPELFEKDFEQYISVDDARIAIAKMFPSPAAFLRYENDRDKFLWSNDWHTIGLKVSWDLFSIPQRLAENEAAELHAELVKRQRTALAVAILTQLHLAIIEYQDSLQHRRMSFTLADKRQRLATAVAAAAEDGKGHEGEAIEQQMKFLAARARFLTDHAALRTAEARIDNTLGRDPTPAPAPTLQPLEPDANAQTEVVPHTPPADTDPHTDTPTEPQAPA